MASSTDSPLIGQVIHHSYDPGYVVLSYVVSLAGCWTALELLHRRTSSHGIHNWYLLVAAAVSMGSVAIWSMHYIGNRAIVMDNNQVNLQIEYSPGYTAGSFFLAICGVGVAFYFFSISENVGVFSTTIGGLILGGAICGMHYMGNGGISNYSPSYTWPCVAGSAIISVTASTAALRVFFHFKAKWTNNWFKRALCASFLAMAVSGMHWVAAVGSQYKLRSLPEVGKDGLSRQATVICVICLAIGSCLVLLIFGIHGQRSRQILSNRVQQIVLASVTFDIEGRILVTPSGYIPTGKLTDKYEGKRFGDIFDVNHPLFCWCFRASRCWNTVANLLPAIRSTHTLNNGPAPTLARSPSRIEASDARSQVDFTEMFKRTFLIVAKELADSIQEPLTSIGYLFDELLNTGTESRLKSAKTIFSRFKRTVINARDLETGEGSFINGRGQFLFTVRRISKANCARLQSSGFMFARIPDILETLAKSMDVAKEDLNALLGRMQDYASSSERFFEPCVYVSLFALRPLLHRPFDVLVQRANKHMLPSVRLTFERLEKWQTNILVELDGSTVPEIQEKLRFLSTSLDAVGRRYVHEIIEALAILRTQVNHSHFDQARLIAKTFRIACYQDSKQMGQTTFIAFRLLMSAHESYTMTQKFEFAPLNFFLARQHASKYGESDAVFSRRLREEFDGGSEQRLTQETTASASRLLTMQPESNPESSGTEPSEHLKSWIARVRSVVKDVLSGPNGSDKQGEFDLHRARTIKAIDSSDRNAGGHGQPSSSRGPTSHVNNSGVGRGKEGSGEETYADQLLAITINEMKNNHRTI